MAGLLSGKVIIVTGAGGGIGRDIARSVAAEGASVIVNDVGAGLDGSGRDVGPAQQVAEELAAAGGVALANTDSVADSASATRIAAAAVDRFGRLDGVVNNAGMLRDGFFYKIPAEDWDQVLKVHLYGTFNVSRAAAAFFNEQSSGSFVHMTSTSGLIGNLAQANYSAAKLVITALSKSIALDMQRFWRALRLHRALRLEPDDQRHQGGHAQGEGEGGTTSAEDAGQDRAARRLSAFRGSSIRLRTNILGPPQ